MPGRLIGLVTLLVATVAILAGAAAAAQGGQVGGPPSFPLQGPPLGARNTPELVIGTGKLAGTTIELVAHGLPARRLGRGSGEAYCVWVAYQDEKGSATPLSCRLANEPLEEGTVAIESQSQLISPKRFRASEVGGSLSPRVASVQVTYQRPGGPRLHAQATVAQVRGGLRKQLKQPAPFGFFFARIHGLFPTESVRVQTFDAHGRLLDTAMGRD